MDLTSPGTVKDKDGDNAKRKKKREKNRPLQLSAGWNRSGMIFHPGLRRKPRGPAELLTNKQTNETNLQVKQINLGTWESRKA